MDIPAERILDSVFHGADALDLLLVGYIAVGLGIIFLTIRRPTIRKFMLAAGCALIILGAVLVLLLKMGKFQECRTIPGTVVYQSANKAAPETRMMNVTECRIRPVGDPEYGSWVFRSIE